MNVVKYIENERGKIMDIFAQYAQDRNENSQEKETKTDNLVTETNKDKETPFSIKCQQFFKKFVCECYIGFLLCFTCNYALLHKKPYHNTLTRLYMIISRIPPIFNK